MQWLRRLFYFLSPYTDPQERAVGLFFGAITEHSDRSQTQSRLLELLQRNIAVINLWTEYKYKGYKYLRKSRRKKLYDNLQLIADDFEVFRRANAQPAETVIARTRHIAPRVHANHDRIVLLQALMDYFAPGRGAYQYQTSSSFSRLLRDPTREVMIGDCNQIVTLYIYLYSRYFDVHDLHIRLLPEHVALHYGGIDIETTSGVFANYADKQGSSLLPIEEIVSINLLDTTDAYLATHEIAPEDFLQASRFAFILSHERSIVTRNLDAAYGKLITLLMNRHNYTKALQFAKASRNMELLTIVGHNGALHHMKHGHFAAARRFAAHAAKRDELIRNSYHAEGIAHFNAHRYNDAIKAFKQYGDQSLVNQCYEALFFVEQEKLGKNLTTESIKKHVKTIKNMHVYAKKSGNAKLIHAADDLKRHL